jgi:hypothetical protein
VHRDLREDALASSLDKQVLELPCMCPKHSLDSTELILGKLPDFPIQHVMVDALQVTFGCVGSPFFEQRCISVKVVDKGCLLGWFDKVWDSFVSWFDHELMHEERRLTILRVSHNICLSTWFKVPRYHINLIAFAFFAHHFFHKTSVDELCFLPSNLSHEHLFDIFD